MGAETHRTVKRPPQKSSASNGQSNGQASGDLRLDFHFNGADYSIGPRDLSAVEARAYRQQMGQSLARTFDEGDLDIDVLATLIWLVDRRSNPRLQWEEIAGQLDYHDVEYMFADEQVQQQPEQQSFGADDPVEASEDPSDSAGSS